MAVKNTSNMTLHDWAKRTDPSGKAAAIVELLNQSNEVLDDMVFKEGNLPTGEQVTMRTGLPTVYYKMMNQGVPSSKSTTAQITENCAIMVGRSQLDVDLAELNGGAKTARAKESMSFTESMNQKQAQTLFYGSAANPTEFVGLANRYVASTDPNGVNIIKAGGAGADNSSMWLIGWSDETIYGMFPKGSTAGLTHEYLGVQDAFDENNNRFRAHMDEYKWKAGLAVADWRFGVRIPNIDISDLIAATGTQATTAATFLPKLMARALHRLPKRKNVKRVFYANRTVMSNLVTLAMEKTSTILSIEKGLTQFGDEFTDLRFLGIPIRLCDAITNAESVVP